MPEDSSNVSWMHARRLGLALQATVQQMNAERLHGAVDDAHASGLNQGLRQGYLEGARAGRLAGFCWGVLLGALSVGWLVGGGS